MKGYFRAVPYQLERRFQRRECNYGKTGEKDAAGKASELLEVQASIRQYEECLDTLREKENELQEQILMEKFREVNGLLEEQNMSLDDLKELLATEGGNTQIA